MGRAQTPGEATRANEFLAKLLRFYKHLSSLSVKENILRQSAYFKEEIIKRI